MSEAATCALKLCVDGVINAALQLERIVGIVVLVAIDGEIVYRRAAGMADRESGVPMREDTIFRLASLTKPIVSAVALQMIADGVISLDEPITSWLPNFRPRLADGSEPVITVRHLLTHTSGLDYGFGNRRSEFAKWQVGTGMDRPGLSSDEQLRRLANITLNFPPGTGWTYSLATDVLGEVLAAACKKALPALVTDLVTSPLGMKDTAFEVRDPSRLAVPYADGMPRPVPIEDDQDVPNRDAVVRFCPSRIFNAHSFPSGGAGLAGTAVDFLRFLEALRQGGHPILDHDSVHLMTSDQLPAAVHYPDSGWRFSMGAAVLAEAKLARTSHDTGTWRWNGGYGHEWFVNPLRNLVVVSMSNTAFEGSDGAFPQNLSDAIYYSLASS